MHSMHKSMRRKQHAHVTPFGLESMGSSWLVPLPRACITAS